MTGHQEQAIQKLADLKAEFEAIAMQASNASPLDTIFGDSQVVEMNYKGYQREVQGALDMLSAQNVEVARSKLTGLKSIFDSKASMYKAMSKDTFDCLLWGMNAQKHVEENEANSKKVDAVLKLI